jgi:hypothetical protein
LRRQAKTTAAKVEETFHQGDEAVRLDPYALPHRFRYDTGTDPRSGKPMGPAAVFLEKNMASICRRLPSGIPMAMRLPMAAFEGVAVRLVADRIGADGDVDGDGLAVVELMHRDPQLSLPLSVAADLTEVAADWKAWARVLGLPMLLVEADGSWRAIEARVGQVVVGAVRPRRARSVLNGRRPRFLTRRKVGVKPATPVMIAKNELFGRE